MPFKILLADDSMTAQKMARDILSKEGYEVIACSNGAAAAKKLAEKPNLYILDVFMPGYTGLELCEKIRATADIAKTPVILTVAKMEPYNPADGQRVGADGVLIKPFEATDLLAVVKKYEAAAAAPAQDKTAVFQAASVEEFKDQSYQEWKESTGEFNIADLQKKGPAKTEVPSDVGSAPAFADMDMMSAPVDPNAPTMEFPAAVGATAFDETVTVPPPPKAAPSMTGTATFDQSVVPAAPAAAVPTLPSEFGFDIPAAVTPVEAAKFDELISAPAVAVPDVPMIMPEAAAPAAPPAKDSLVEFTSAPRAGHVEVEVEHGLEQAMETAPEGFVPAPDPSLVTDRTQMASEFATKFGSEKEEEVGFVKGFEKPEVEVAAIPTGEQLSQAEIDALKGGAAAAPAADDFEARVAAAMSGFEEPSAMEAPPPPVETAPVEMPPVVEAAPPPPPIVEEPPPPPVVEEVPVYERTQKIQVPIEVMEEVPAPPAPEPEPEPVPIPEIAEAQQVPEGMADASLVEQMQAAFKDLPIENVPVEEPPAPAPEAEVGTSTLMGIGAAAAAAIAGTAAVSHQKEAVMIPEPPPAPAPPSGPDMELAAQLAAAVGGETPSVPMVTDASGKPVARHDRQTVTLTVHRVMQRMLPKIMEEVSKELEEEEKKS